MTALDYGTLLCWANNEIGPQKEPCVFHIVPAGKPEPPGECRVEEGTRTSVWVRCGAGGSGGLPQHFLLQASSLHQPHHQHLLNFTSASSPNFYVEGLEARGKYQLVIRAVNDKGSSSAAHLTVTSIDTKNYVYQLHDGPLEAEVRDGGKNGVVGGESEVPEESFLDALALPSFIMGVLGVGSGLVLLVILLLLIITFRGRRRAPQLHPLAHNLHLTDTEESLPSGASPGVLSHVLTPDHLTTSLEGGVMQHQTESESDIDPDVIPLQESIPGGDTEVVTLQAATVLPSHHYYSTMAAPTAISENHRRHLEWMTRASNHQGAVQLNQQK
ncbi:Nephrin-like 23 [Homarus americanus]|uniref:Nephrin-like 23 n=1 Tax=Homarus americanus TaxID=6706 RepID=A0A8J5JBT9_HOMAM|nr:Nephrin-like 23 [Homarus americanus]